MDRIRPIADFLNHCIYYHIKVNPIPTNKPRKPHYLRTDIFTRGSCEWILHMLNRSVDVMVIATDLRYPPMKILENVCVEAGYPCYKTDKKPINNNYAKDKILMTTLDTLSPSDTRKIVVVMTSKMTTPQEIFRSCSRATEWLIVIDDCRKEKDCLPFEINETYIENINKRAKGVFKSYTKVKEEEDKDLSNIKEELINPPNDRIIIPSGSRDNFVADITGLAIPMIYEYKNTGKIRAIDFIQQSRRYILAHKRFIHFADFSKISDVLKLANLYLYIIQGYKSRYEELSLEDYDWLSQEIVDKLLNRMEKHISSTNNDYEVKIGNYYVDAIDYDKNILWEIKCKRFIEQKDIRQLKRYAKADKFKRSYRLINLITEEIITLNIDKPNALFKNNMCLSLSNYNSDDM